MQDFPIFINHWLEKVLEFDFHNCMHTFNTCGDVYSFVKNNYKDEVQLSINEIKLLNRLF